MKAVKIGALVVVILGAFVLGIRQYRKSRVAPDWVTEKMVELIDKETAEVISRPLGEWGKLGTKDGYFKNPNTGRFTMTTPVTCMSCGEIVVGPPNMSIPSGVKDPDALLEQRKQEWKNVCPKCGGRIKPRW